MANDASRGRATCCLIFAAEWWWRVPDSIPPTTAFSELRSLRARQAAERLAIGSKYPSHDLVACDEVGTPVRPERYSDLFGRLCASAGVPAIRLHDARHTSVTLMLDAGHPIASVAAWHGHSPDEMLRTYCHSTPEGLAAISASLPGAGSSASSAR